MRTHQNQPFVVQREVKSVMVPAGIEVTLKPGQAGYITQALGGSFTLYIDGNLFRLAGEHAEAIGQEVVKAPELSYTRSGGSLAPGDSAISRNGTRMSVCPSGASYTLDDPIIGPVVIDGSWKSAGLAILFMASAPRRRLTSGTGAVTWG